MVTTHGSNDLKYFLPRNQSFIGIVLNTSGLLNVSMSP